MARYAVNDRAVERARRLIAARQYVLDSQWGDVQPDTEAENAYLASHSYEEYGEWFLGLTEGPADDTQARYAARPRSPHARARRPRTAIRPR